VPRHSQARHKPGGRPRNPRGIFSSFQRVEKLPHKERRAGEKEGCTELQRLGQKLEDKLMDRTLKKRVRRFTSLG